MIYQLWFHYLLNMLNLTIMCSLNARKCVSVFNLISATLNTPFNKFFLGRTETICSVKHT